MNKTTYDLLIGNLWIPDTEKISRLQQMHKPCETKTASLKIKTGKYVEPIFTEQKVIPDSDLSVPKVASLPISPVTNIKKEPVTDESSWQTLVNEISNCEKCKLCYGRTNIVIERGNRLAPWMFIGEGPGEQEDIQGKPFVGASGQLLDKMIAAMKLNTTEDIYIANVIKCRPPHNRNPEEEEIAACNNYLINQIRLVNPQIIITLGRFAVQTLLNTDLAIGKLRKQVHRYQQIPLIVTYHPSYLLRTPAAKKDAWEDLQLAMQTFAGLTK